MQTRVFAKSAAFVCFVSVSLCLLHHCSAPDFTFLLLLSSFSECDGIRLNSGTHFERVRNVYTLSIME